MTYSRLIVLVCFIGINVFSSVLIFGITTGGVISPVVTPGHRSVELRTGLVPDSEFTATRIHVQQAVGDVWMPRLTVSFKDTSTGSADISSVQASLLWNVTQRAQAYQQGLWFDVAVRPERNVSSYSVFWLHQYSVGNLLFRGNVVGALNADTIGAEAVSWQFRGQVARKLWAGVSAGLETFNQLGTLNGSVPLRELSQELGPFVSWSGSRTRVYLSYLDGLTAASEPGTFRVFLNQSF